MSTPRVLERHVTLLFGITGIHKSAFYKPVWSARDKENMRYVYNDMKRAYNEFTGAVYTSLQTWSAYLTEDEVAEWQYLETRTMLQACPKLGDLMDSY